MLAKIAQMLELDSAIAERLHAIIKASVPTLSVCRQCVMLSRRLDLFSEAIVATEVLLAKASFRLCA
jgi:hypothetical protein